MIPIVIMGVPDRKDLIMPLYRKLKVDQGNVVVQLDEAHAGAVVNNRDCWNLLLSSFPGQPYYCLIQDDALPCVEFPATLQVIADIVVDKPVFLYCTFKACQKVIDREEHWGKVLAPVWGVCQLLPRAMIEGYLEWLERNEAVVYQDKYKGWDDFWLALYARMHNWAHGLVTVPSLVEHIGTGRSVLSHPANTVAYQFIGENVSGLSIDWTLPEKILSLGSGQASKADIKKYGLVK